MGKPDVVLSMTDEFSIPAEGVVNYKYFAVPTNFTEDRYVQFAEISIGDRAHVHHVIVGVRNPGQGPLPPAGEISRERLGQFCAGRGATTTAPGRHAVPANKPD